MHVIGRRLPVVDGKMTMPSEPGDYCGPLRGPKTDVLPLLVVRA